MTVQRLTRDERRDIVNDKMMVELLHKIPLSEAMGMIHVMNDDSIQSLSELNRICPSVEYPINGDLIARLV